MGRPIRIRPELEEAMDAIEAGRAPSPNHVRLDVVGELFAIRRTHTRTQGDALIGYALDFMATGIEPEFGPREQSISHEWRVLRSGFERRRRAAMNGAKGGNPVLKSAGSGPASVQHRSGIGSAVPMEEPQHVPHHVPQQNTPTGASSSGNGNSGFNPDANPEQGAGFKLSANSEEREASQRRVASVDATQRAVDGQVQPANDDVLVSGPLDAARVRAMVAGIRDADPGEYHAWRTFRRIHSVLGMGESLESFDASSQELYRAHAAEWGPWCDALDGEGR